VYLRNKRLFVETSYVTASRKQWVYTDTSGVAWVCSKLQSVKDSVVIEGRPGGSSPENIECVSQFCAILYRYFSVNVQYKSSSNTS